MTAEPPRWRAEALCAGGALNLAGIPLVQFDSDWWFADDQGDPCFLAKRVCAACPVRGACLDDALERNEEFGIWGGAGESVRRALRNLEPAARDDAVARHFVRLDHLAEHGVQAAGTTASFGPGATHGKKSTYKRGCRGDDCRDAMGLARRGIPCPYVPTEDEKAS